MTFNLAKLPVVPSQRRTQQITAGHLVGQNTTPTANASQTEGTRRGHTRWMMTMTIMAMKAVQPA